MSFRRGGRPRALRRGLVGVLMVAGAWSAGAWPAGAAGVAPAAVAADVRSKQWYLDAMRAEDMWKVTTGEGIKVAVIDTGVNPDTPSLRGQVLKGLDATGAEGDETDDYTGHGTTMAELIAGTGKGGGLRGLAPGVKIIPMRVSNTDFQNQQRVNGQDSEDAIRAAADSDAQIISMSFAGEYSSVSESQAVEYAESKGKLFFAGAGNNARSGNKPQYPAAYPEVAGVASTDRTGRVSDYSQHGDNVSIAAPGNDIPRWCDERFRGYCEGDGGTSAATAIASASAALVWSVHPDWTANQVLRVLLDTAGRDWDKDTRSTYLGAGLIRPGANVLHGKGTPGDPDISPLHNRRTRTLASPSASAARPAASPAAASAAPRGRPADHAVAAGTAGKAAAGSSWGPVLAAAAAVLVAAGGGVAVARRRRTG